MCNCKLIIEGLIQGLITKPNTQHDLHTAVRTSCEHQVLWTVPEVSNSKVRRSQTSPLTFWLNDFPPSSQFFMHFLKKKNKKNGAKSDVTSIAVNQKWPLIVRSSGCGVFVTLPSLSPSGRAGSCSSRPVKPPPSPSLCTHQPHILLMSCHSQTTM